METSRINREVSGSEWPAGPRALLSSKLIEHAIGVVLLKVGVFQGKAMERSRTPLCESSGFGSGE